MYRFTIKDVESLTGFKAHTIRIWEKRYSFLKPGRSDTNIRFYSCKELETLLDVCLLNKYGYKISAIVKMTKDGMQDTIKSMQQPQTQCEYAVNKLVLFLFNIDADNFEKLLNDYVTSKGITACLSHLINLFLIKLLPLRDKINLSIPDNIFLNILRQKIISGIEEQNNFNKSAKTVLVFLPENAYYEIELLYMQYLIKSKGLNVIYLGANVPLNDVVKIAMFKKPDHIYTQLNNEVKSFKAIKYFKQLSILFKEFNVIVTARPSLYSAKEIPSNIQLDFSLAGSLKFIP